MAQTLVNIRIDEDVKKQMEELCKELGLTMSAAFNIFARKMIRENGIPFEVSADAAYYNTDSDEYSKDIFDKETVKKLLKSEEDIEQGKTKNAANVVKELREKYGF